MALQASEITDIWKRIIETQMHFNEMSTKSRQLGLTLVVAALGLCAVLIGRGDDFSLVVQFCSMPVRIHVAVLVLLASALGLYGVKQLDLGVYHQMLRGAVKFGEEFEQQNMVASAGVPLGLTQFVSLYSRYATVQKVGTEYVGVGEKLAGTKLNRFYWISICAICGFALAIFVVTQHGMTVERPTAVQSHQVST
jgi:hypothetical protein